VDTEARRWQIDGQMLHAHGMGRTPFAEQSCSMELGALRGPLADEHAHGMHACQPRCARHSEHAAGHAQPGRDPNGMHRQAMRTSVERPSTHTTTQPESKATTAPDEPAAGEPSARGRRMDKGVACAGQDAGRGAGQAVACAGQGVG
jgi:hypothetical protein